MGGRDKGREEGLRELHKTVDTNVIQDSHLIQRTVE